MAPSIWYFDDKFLSPAFSKATLTKVSSIVREVELAAKEAFDREDDRTPEERETFKQVRGLCRRH